MKINPKKMKVIRLTNSKLNEMIKRVIEEQEDEQFGTTGPEAGEVTGSPEDESGEPNYDEFLECAKKLLDQGITIGALIDKMLESQNTEPEVEPGIDEPEPDSAIPSDNQ